jgi:hypothetical protein
VAVVGRGFKELKFFQFIFRGEIVIIYKFLVCQYTLLYLSHSSSWEFHHQNQEQYCCDLTNIEENHLCCQNKKDERVRRHSSHSFYRRGIKRQLGHAALKCNQSYCPQICNHCYASSHIS